MGFRGIYDKKIKYVRLRERERERERAIKNI